MPGSSHFTGDVSNQVETENLVTEEGKSSDF
jgi:hypothetical protein